MKINKLKSYFSLLIVIVVLTGVLYMGSRNNTINEKVVYSADWKTYSDIAPLEEDSDLIITGDIISNDKTEKVYYEILTDDKMLARLDEGQKEALKVAKENSFGVYRISEVKVIKVIKGNIKPGDIIKIGQLGGVDGKTEYEMKDVNYFKKGEQNVFFLQENDSFYMTLNPWQGHIKIDSGKVKADVRNSLFNDVNTVDELESKIKKSKNH